MTAPTGPPGEAGNVCVIGGGLAGIAAAIRLADLHLRVTLLESRPELGGATYSFRRDGLTVDTGQHVFLRCYEAYRGLLDRLGSTAGTQVQPRFAVPVLLPGRPPHLLARRRLPAPAHLLPALAGYRLLAPAQRLAAVRAAAALRHVDPDLPETDARSFGDWLADHGQDARAVRRLWDLVTVAALNLPSAQASLALAARVFRTGLLEAADAGDIGRPLVPLVDLHAVPARRLLDRLGVRVRTRARVRWIRPEPAGFRVGTDDGEVDADAVVLAVPHQAAAALVPPAAAPAAGDWRRLGAAPIVNVHLRYARRITGLTMAAAVASPAQWIFTRPEPDGQYVVVSLSAADAELERPTAELVATQRAALAALFPAARHAAVRDAFVTREPRATFRQTPGTRAYRPATATGLPGLVLAGAWTDTGWPDTMEGAVRSGQQAADVVARQLASRPRHHTEAAR
ncbi:hydroxysqualene dehydroxylase HpnE [Micromonospora olivasterospora]|uniref:Squalene-associated FAD-dependent desaturase n=1 Tax=Micromonospora olivasterospora TaxID=1880 RepID=A0A562IGL2_MICOL|nr:hydroxysqualene dehydroxylase HpnE [Micromonospora olivasterospora]TWH70159.1 squalene-associated FAD-dependent desaturase [Micromonospora olivasterospora]